MNARSSHALTALPLIAAAMLAVPGAAQQVAPPPVTATQAAPVPQTVAPPPVVATTPGGSSGVSQAPAPATAAGGSATSIDPQAAANAAAERAERRSAIRAAPPRAAPAARSVVAPAATTPAAATPASASIVSDAPSVPVATDAPPPAPAASPNAQAAAPAAPARDGSLWPWIAAALAVVAVAAALVLWRRRRAREEAMEETAYTTDPIYEEPVGEAVVRTADAVPAPVAREAAVAAPVAVAASPMATARDDLPVATVEEASIARPDSEDVEALTAAAPVAGRPWLELAMRPVRAGTTEENAQVEIELTVGNAGAVDAEDVRVAAFMLADADDGEIERMLVDPPAGEAVEPLRIGAGEGARVDATLTLPRGSLASEARFRPVVIAEARYRLPDGGEGRTAASFDIGVASDPDAPLPPISTAGTELRDDVEARLHRAAEHA